MGQIHQLLSLTPLSSSSSSSINGFSKAFSFPQLSSLFSPPHLSPSIPPPTLFTKLSLSHSNGSFSTPFSLGFPLVCHSNGYFSRPFSSGFSLVCHSNGSDMVSQLELKKPDGRRKPEKRVNGIFWIILLNLGIYVADHVFQVRAIKTLYLYHNWPAWYQFVTAAFCHANWNHLSSNLFFLYIFGKLVEEEEGGFALWLSYILTGAGANLVSWLVLPRNAVSVGASGAVFGLFAISVLVKMSWDWRKILEVLILGQFVIEKVMEAAQASTGLSNGFVGAYSLQNVNHIAHLSGALVGVLLVWLVSRIPSYSSEEDRISDKSEKLR